MGEITINKSAVELASRWFARGVISEVSRIALWMIVALALAGPVITMTGEWMGLGPPDDSDVSWSERSGVRVRKDALTGCQYLETAAGSLSPRLLADGHQVCRR